MNVPALLQDPLAELRRDLFKIKPMQTRVLCPKRRALLGQAEGLFEAVAACAGDDTTFWAG